MAPDPNRETEETEQLPLDVCLLSEEGAEIDKGLACDPHPSFVGSHATYLPHMQKAQCWESKREWR